MYRLSIFNIARYF